MTLNYIGLIKGAKQVSRKNKETKQTILNTEVTILLEDHDVNGELVFETANIQFDIEKLAEFKGNVGKFVSIPHKLINIKSGTYCFPDDDMVYTFYDKNPLIKTK